MKNGQEMLMVRPMKLNLLKVLMSDERVGTRVR